MRLKKEKFIKPGTVEHLLKNRNESAQQVCKSLGWAHSTLSHYLTGQNHISPKRIKALADYFEVQPSSLVSTQPTKKQLKVFEKTQLQHLRINARQKAKYLEAHQHQEELFHDLAENSHGILQIGALNDLDDLNKKLDQVAEAVDRLQKKMSVLVNYHDIKNLQLQADRLEEKLNEFADSQEIQKKTNKAIFARLDGISKKLDKQKKHWWER